MQPRKIRSKYSAINHPRVLFAVYNGGNLKTVKRGDAPQNGANWCHQKHLKYVKFNDFRECYFLSYQKKIEIHP